jgi:hypothetical protein
VIAVRKFSAPAICIALLLVVTAPAFADDPAFDAVSKQFKERLHAREVHIPFFGLARFATRIIKPAGVKSIRVKIFDSLHDNSRAAFRQLEATLGNSLPPGWFQVIKVSSREGGQQTLIYVREDGKDIKLMVLNFEDGQAVVAKVKISPESLRKFLDNPKLLGISLRDTDGG